MNNLNACEYDLVNGIQQQFRRKLYDLGTVTAIMDIGNIRRIQEDSVLITSHYNVPNVELLLVADGMGGLKNGSMASRIAAIETWKWFQSLHQELFDIEHLKDATFSYIETIDELIRIKCKEGGTTFAGAFILKNKVLIANVGDSRVYIYDSGNLSQVTVDQSITQELFDNETIACKDNMRFHKKNNLILSRLGCEKKMLKLDFFELDISEFEQLFLFTDGVTDCISDNRLQSIISEGIHDKVCENIINEVMLVDSFSYKLDPDIYYNKISAGKDNASIIYKKNRRK